MTRSTAVTSRPVPSLRGGRATVTPGSIEPQGSPRRGLETMLQWDPPRARHDHPGRHVPRGRRNGLPVHDYTTGWGACEAADPRFCPFHGPRLAALDTAARAR